MENKNILRRTFSFLVDKVLILLFFIIIVVSISPYWAPGALGTYSAILEMSPSHYYSQDLYSNDLYFTVYFIIVNLYNEYTSLKSRELEELPRFRVMSWQPSQLPWSASLCLLG